MEIKNEHMEALEQAFFENLRRIDFEYGMIGIDGKRPFGNSDVERDILEDIIEAEQEGDDGDGPCYSSKQREYTATLYDNLIPWLQKKYLHLPDTETICIDCGRVWPNHEEQCPHCGNVIPF